MYDATNEPAAAALQACIFSRRCFQTRPPHPYKNEEEEEESLHVGLFFSVRFSSQAEWQCQLVMEKTPNSIKRTQAMHVLLNRDKLEKINPPHSKETTLARKGELVCSRVFRKTHTRTRS